MDAAASAHQREALALARRGLGRTWPNPAVGAVLVAGGEVVGRGWHPRAGEPHAEVFALREAGARARGATAYVTLEPCSHHGRTPPCADALLEAGVARVRYGVADPNPEVAGRGAARLAAAGVDVAPWEGEAAAAAAELVSGFRSRVLRGRPEVLLKAALTLDGQLAPASGRSRWITGPASRGRVHELRDRWDGIAVGSGTVLADAPSLTVRDPAPADGHQPLRVVFDGRGRVPSGAACLGAGALVMTGPASPPAWRDEVATGGAEVVEVPAGPGGGVDLAAALQALGERGLTRLLVEGGGGLHGGFLAAGLADRVALFYAPLLVGAGGHPLAGAFRAAELAGGVRLAEAALTRLGPDWLVEGWLRYPGDEEAG